MEVWDLIVLGAGPAGLTAALYGVRSGLSTLVIEEKTVGGLLLEVPFVENYPGVGGTTGINLAQKMSDQVKDAGAEIHEIEIAESMRVGEPINVRTDRGEYSSRSLIISTGASHRTLDVPGEKQLTGRGVSLCALCDGVFFREKRVAVAGGGNSAATSALYMSGLAKEVSLVHRRGVLRADKAWIDAIEKKGVHLLLNKEVIEIKGESHVTSVVLRDTRNAELTELEVDGLFIEIGQIPSSKVAAAAGIKVDSQGYIVVNTAQATNLPGVYAAGDVTNSPIKQVATAVGQGAVAATEAFVHIKRPYYRRMEEPYGD